MNLQVGGKRTGSEREKTGLAGGRVEERIHGQLSREKLSGKRVMYILGSCLLNLLSGQRKDASTGYPLSQKGLIPTLIPKLIYRASFYKEGT